MGLRIEQGVPVYSQSVNSGATSARPVGLMVFGVFLPWGAAMATVAGVTLLWRGTMLDRIWSLNPRAHIQLAPLGVKAGILMLVVAGALSVAGVGWLHFFFGGRGFSGLGFFGCARLALFRQLRQEVLGAKGFRMLIGIAVDVAVIGMQPGDSQLRLAIDHQQPVRQKIEGRR